MPCNGGPARGGLPVIFKRQPAPPPPMRGSLASVSEAGARRLYLALMIQGIAHGYKQLKERTHQILSRPERAFITTS